MANEKQLIERVIGLEARVRILEEQQHGTAEILRSLTTVHTKLNALQARGDQLMASIDDLGPALDRLQTAITREIQQLAEALAGGHLTPDQQAKVDDFVSRVGSMTTALGADDPTP